jgi:uncharacterized protein (TIGR03435 family)
MVALKFYRRQNITRRLTGMRNLLIVKCWAAFLIAAVASAQTTPNPASPQFEVAAIKPNNSGARTVSICVPSPGSFRAQNVWLRFLVQVAWDVKDFQVLGGPGWATSDRYDVTAKATENAQLPEMRPMLKALLEDRFQLTLHTETRELPAYALLVGKGAVKLRQTSEGSCAMPNSDMPPSSPNPLPVCGNISVGTHSADGVGISMAQLASSLSESMQRTVVDQTALTGKFDVHMEWAVDQSTPGFWAPGLSPAPSADASSDSGSSIFTVIREQLGLALVARKSPVTVLVIDHAERPSPN